MVSECAERRKSVPKKRAHLRSKEQRRAAFALTATLKSCHYPFYFLNPSACQPKPWRRLVEAAGVEPEENRF